MEFYEKLQELRKKRGLTQEELAQMLFVSRTAVSKWELGRGYPNIESLKAIAGVFSVTIDSLLSGDELLNVAEEDYKEKENQLRDIVFGLLDISIAVLFFLPFFGQKSFDLIQSVSLLSLGETAWYLKTAYTVCTTAMVVWGILTLALQNFRGVFRKKYRYKISLGIHAGFVLLLMAGMQPYAGALLFLFLIIKTAILVKWR